MKIAVADRRIFATLTELKADRSGAGSLEAKVQYIGVGVCNPTGELTEFNRGVSIYPHPGDQVSFASESDLELIYSPQDTPHVRIGNVYPTDHVPAPIFFDMLLGRHFAVVGSSGTGKSTSVALILNRIIEHAPNSHVIILDPHGEYPKSFGDKGMVWDVNNLTVPYWAMSLQEHCEAFISSTGDARAIDTNILAKCLVQARLKNPHIANAGKITADSPVAYQLEDLLDALDEDVGKLEKAADAHHYIQLKLNIEQFFKDRRYHFIFNEAYWDISLPELLSSLLRIPVEGKPVSIIDLAGVPSEIVTTVVSTISRLIFDYAVWAPRDTRLPVLFVCEEAHRYLPRARSGRPVSAERQLERIAREGRKYGVCLGLITQRPSELSETALSQCGTMISLRLNNEQDQAQMRAVLSEGAASFVDIIPALQNRECIVSGEGAPVPMRVRIDTLEDRLRPASEDPVFSEKWTLPSNDRSLLDEAIRRWIENG